MILYPSWILARVYDNNTPSNIRNINYIFLALENLVGKNYYPRVKSRRFVTSRICHYIYIIISQLLIKLSIYSLISKLLLPQSELSIIRAFCPQVHLTPGPLNPAVVLWPTNSPSNLNTHTHTLTTSDMCLIMVTMVWCPAGLTPWCWWRCYNLIIYAAPLSNSVPHYLVYINCTVVSDRTCFSHAYFQHLFCCSCMNQVYSLLCCTVYPRFTVHVRGKEICTVYWISVTSNLHIMLTIWED